MQVGQGGDHCGAAEDGGELPVGEAGAVAQWPEAEAGHAQRERLEVLETILPVVLAMERDLVHHTYDAAIVRRPDPHLDHRIPLHRQERFVDPVPAEDRFDRSWHAVDQGRRRGQYDEHRQQGAVVDQERHLRSPEQGRREPVTERRGGHVAVAGARALHPIAQLLGASDHEHQRSLAARSGSRRLGPDLYPLLQLLPDFYRTG